MATSSTSAAAKGATYLIALQVSSRALTFLLNQILLRFLTPATLGRAVQLELYSISVLFFARESLRVAVQRVGSTDAKSEPVAVESQDEKSKATESSKTQSKKASGVQIVVNLSYLSLLLGIPLALLLGGLSWTTLSGAEGEIAATPYIGHAVFIYGLAAVIELASEPGFVAAQTLLLFKVRAGAEAAGTIVKTFATVGSALVAHRLRLDLGVVPFAFGQLAFASTLLLHYILKLTPVGNQNSFTLLPTRLNQPTQSTNTSQTNNDYLFSYFSRPLLKIAGSLTIQSTIKYILTQGDSLLITALATLQDQGSYALASNYGGLIARMLFQPIEEASRNLFAKLCASSAPDPKLNAKPTPSPGPQRAAQILTTILKIYTLLSLPIATLGPSLAPPLLSLVAGPRWTALGAGDVLGAYAYYIPFLALNGVLEAFVSATATNKALYVQSLWMGASFVAFAGTAWGSVVAAGLGARGVVLANAVNMVGRIAWCARFVRGWFGGREVEFKVLDVLPSAGSVAVAATVPVLLNASKGILGAYGVLGEIVRVGAVGVVLVAAIGIFEIQFFKQCYTLIKSSR
ncbi:hypothetical protein B9Z65_6473 [Elsinoe australis]|uniref:Man(5)GlcNAc(2)-PP-dolichol translocation protein RFT1 n=1 Tax=Elsinoe australis TaxID=40998 RepID=A0A2P8A8Q9_9PEZI|nr:hypothetical protein B9Z65_6473 [Elsinoe australis]